MSVTTLLHDTPGFKPEHVRESFCVEQVHELSISTSRALSRADDKRLIFGGGRG